jgi:hypothetical protein
MFFLDITKGIDFTIGLFLVLTIHKIRKDIFPLTAQTKVATALHGATFLPYVLSWGVLISTIVSSLPVYGVFHDIGILQFQLQMIGLGVLVYLYDWIHTVSSIFYSLTNKKLLFVVPPSTRKKLMKYREPIADIEVHYNTHYSQH